MKLIQVPWSIMKSFVDARGVSIQWVSLEQNYWLQALDGNFGLECFLLNGTPADADQADFEANYKNTGNKSPNQFVTTQFELNDKDLKLARAKIAITNGSGTAYIPVPGTFGAPGEGRYVAGGYALIDTWDGDDNVRVYVEDKDRLLAAAYGALTDEQMRAQGDFPAYPIVKSYTDDEVPVENQGWHFWPYHAVNGSPTGETEVDPIGGYGFLPSGFYLKIIVTRPNVQGGTAYFDIFWGKKE